MLVSSHEASSSRCISQLCITIATIPERTTQEERSFLDCRFGGSQSKPGFSPGAWCLLRAVGGGTHVEGGSRGGPGSREGTAGLSSAVIARSLGSTAFQGNTPRDPKTSSWAPFLGVIIRSILDPLTISISLWGATPAPGPLRGHPPC